MDLLQSLLYGLLSGVSEFMPISSFGHQAMLRRLFGASYWDPAMDLFVHMALCLAALLVFRGNIDGYIREIGLRQHRSRKRRSFSAHRRIKSSPGSEMQGIPASVTIAQFSPCSMR